MKRFVIAATLAALAVASSPDARAQSLASVTPAERQAAHDRFRAGAKLFNAAEQKHETALYEAAYAEFAQALAVYPNERILWNLAVCEIETQRYIDAARHLREYERRQQSATEPPTRAKREELRAYLEQANAAIGHLAIEADPGARIVLDGRELGSAPLRDSVDVVAGHHVVIAEVGGTRREVPVLALRGELTAVRVVAPKPALPITLPTAALGAEEARDELKEEADRERFWTTRRTIGALVASAGVASLGGGLIFATSARRDRDRADALHVSLPEGGAACAPGLSTACDAFARANDAQARHHTMSLVFGAAGTVALLGGAALILWPDAKPHASRALIVPFVSPFGGGVQVAGSL